MGAHTWDHAQNGKRRTRQGKVRGGYRPEGGRGAPFEGRRLDTGSKLVYQSGGRVSLGLWTPGGTPARMESSLTSAGGWPSGGTARRPPLCRTDPTQAFPAPVGGTRPEGVQSWHSGTSSGCTQSFGLWRARRTSRRGLRLQTGTAEGRTPSLPVPPRG